MNAVTDTQRFVGVWELEGIEEGDSFEGGRGGSARDSSDRWGS